MCALGIMTLIFSANAAVAGSSGQRQATGDCESKAQVVLEAAKAHMAIYTDAEAYFEQPLSTETLASYAESAMDKAAAEDAEAAARLQEMKALVANPQGCTETTYYDLAAIAVDYEYSLPGKRARFEGLAAGIMANAKRMQAYDDEQEDRKRRRAEDRQWLDQIDAIGSRDWNRRF